MIPSLLLGHDQSIATLYAITASPQDPTARRRYRRWVELGLHRVAAVTGSADRTPPAPRAEPVGDATPEHRRFRSPAVVRG